MVVKDSDEEKIFINKLVKSISSIDTNNLLDVESLKNIVLTLAHFIWNLEKYRLIKHIKDWKQFKRAVNSTKWLFFDQKIQEISNKRRGPWELMNWVNKRKLPVIKAIKYNSHLCIEIEDLWSALHSLFSKAKDCQIDFDILDKISNKWSAELVSFSEEEFTSSIAKCNNSSTPGPDKLSWRHLKCIVKNKSCLKRIINIADTCFELGYWLFYFKVSTSIIIPKPNKESYDSPKSFRPIVLLNTIGKLIKKVIGDRLQFHFILNNFIYPSQLSGLKQRLMSDACCGNYKT